MKCYVGPTEAAHWLFELPMYRNSHTVLDLPVYLLKENFVLFNNTDEIAAAALAATRSTKLTAWLQLNQSSNNQVPYVDMPLHFRWVQNSWLPRTRRCRELIGRLNIVPPKQADRFALRLFLLRVSGAKSFDGLKQFDGVAHETFQAAARARGLLQDEAELELCLNEIVHIFFPHQIREAFAYILIFTSQVNAKEIFEQFQSFLIEDFVRENGQGFGVNCALRHIYSILSMHRRSFREFGFLFDDSNQDNVVNATLASNPSDEYSAFMEICNEEQSNVIQTIIDAVQNPETSQSNAFFIDGAGGTGKTAIYNALINYMISRERKVIAVAWTGTAATLLSRGRTSRNRFGIPIIIHETSVSSIKVRSKEGRILSEADLITWEEASMIPGRA